MLLSRQQLTLLYPHRSRKGWGPKKVCDGAGWCCGDGGEEAEASFYAFLATTLWPWQLPATRKHSPLSCSQLNATPIRRSIRSGEVRGRCCGRWLAPRTFLGRIHGGVVEIRHGGHRLLKSSTTSCMRNSRSLEGQVGLPRLRSVAGSPPRCSARCCIAAKKAVNTR